MVKEYVVDIRIYRRLRNSKKFVNHGGGEIIIWGVDEFDALERAFNKAAKNQGFPDEYKELAKTDNIPEEIFFKWSQFRPTGRIKDTFGDKSKPYFNTAVRPYINGLITRFMARFSVSRTENEISGYLEQFEMFLEHYKDEFTSDIIYKMKEYYQSRLNKIKSGELKPFVAERNYMSSDDAYHIALTLKGYGYRVEFNKKEKLYKVIEPKYYNRMFFFGIAKDEELIIPDDKMVAYWYIKTDYLL